MREGGIPNPKVWRDTCLHALAQRYKKRGRFVRACAWLRQWRKPRKRSFTLDLPKADLTKWDIKEPTWFERTFGKYRHLKHLPKSHKRRWWKFW